MKSSASVSLNRGNFRSAPRIQNPSRFNRLTRWWPMNPPAPQTRATLPPDGFEDILVLQHRVWGYPELLHAVTHATALRVTPMSHPSLWDQRHALQSRDFRPPTAPNSEVQQG